MLFATQEINIMIHKTVVKTTNSWQEYHKTTLQTSRSCGIELTQKLHKKLGKNTQKYSNQEE